MFGGGISGGYDEDAVKPGAGDCNMKSSALELHNGDNQAGENT